jgi:recombinational DNA repair protein (RecF pathway)
MMIDGVILQKIPYKERDLITKVLTRDGRSLSLYVYGGAGGGKKQKPSKWEVGHLVKFKLQDKKSTHSQSDMLWNPTDVEIKWEPKFIRYNVEAFFLLCFYVEIASRLSISFDKENLSTDKSEEGLFNVVSNGIFYLDHSLETKNFHTNSHLLFFLSKLLFQLGVLPELDECLICHENFDEKKSVLNIEQGGFICSNCTNVDHDETYLKKSISFALKTKFQDYHLFNYKERQKLKNLVDFMCHHLQLPVHHFRSVSSIWE